MHRLVGFLLCWRPKLHILCLCYNTVSVHVLMCFQLRVCLAASSTRWGVLKCGAEVIVPCMPLCSHSLVWQKTKPTYLYQSIQLHAQLAACETPPDRQQRGGELQAAADAPT